MELIEAINLRKSIRGYKPDPIPKEVMKGILEVASRAPSAKNAQPWECTVIAGEVLAKIKQANLEKRSSAEPPQPNVTREGDADKYRKREVAIGIQLFQLMNIGREDREKRAEWLRRGLRFFDAPAVIIISMDESLREPALLSIGAFTQTIALVALNHGLGTCIQMPGITYPDIIRKFTGIPESQQLILYLTIGYPDWDFPANKAHSEREPIDNIVTWCGI